MNEEHNNLSHAFHQQELEEQEQILRNDVGYQEWLNKLNFKTSANGKDDTKKLILDYTEKEI